MTRTSDQPNEDLLYEIRVKGHLHNRWTAWLDGLELSRSEDGTTLLRGRVADQAALHGLLNKLRDIGLPLVSVEQVDPADAFTVHATARNRRSNMTTMQRTSVPRAGHSPADQLRRTATIVGWLFVITYVTSIASKIALYPPLFDGDYVTGPGQDTRVLWGAVSEAVLIIANIGTATALYTVIKRKHPNLAISYVAARIMESVFIGVGILSVLVLVTLRQDYASTDGAAAAGLTAVGDALVALQEWTFALGPSFVVGVGNGCILGYIMYRTGLVPRRLAMFGLVGGPLIILSGSAAMLGVIELDGTWQQLSAAPEFIWELGLGIYLIVKGFKSSPVTTGIDDPR